MMMRVGDEQPRRKPSFARAARLHIHIACDRRPTSRPSIVCSYYIHDFAHRLSTCYSAHRNDHTHFRRREYIEWSEVNVIIVDNRGQKATAQVVTSASTALAVPEYTTYSHLHVHFRLHHGDRGRSQTCSCASTSRRPAHHPHQQTRKHGKWRRDHGDQKTEAGRAACHF